MYLISQVGNFAILKIFVRFKYIRNSKKLLYKKCETSERLHMKSLIYLFPDFEFDVRNNEGDDASDLADGSY